MSRRWWPTNAPPAPIARRIACSTPRPSAKALFLRAAERGAHLGVLTRGLLQLLASHGAAALEAAIAAALAEDAAHLGAVRHFIDQHAHARGQRPPIAVALPARSAAAAHRAAAAVERLPPTRHHRHRR